MSKIKIVGIVDRPPFSFKTWSGSSRYFFKMLESKGVLVKAISADPGALCRRMIQLISFSPTMRRWKMKYSTNTLFFKIMTSKALKELSNIKDEYNVVIQIGAWYNLSYSVNLQGKLICSYHDGNLATQLSRPDICYNSDLRWIKKALDYEKELYSSIDLIFPMSNWLRSSFVRDFFCDKKKVISVGAGINLDVNNYETKKYSVDPKSILFVGADFDRKGGPHLLEAFKIIRHKIHDLSLSIVGPDLTLQQDGVICYGRLDKNKKKDNLLLSKLYQKAALFVMPSLYEPFGIVFAEAMAHSTPCIGTNNCAMPEIIDHGRTGYLVEVGDVDGLAKRITELIHNRDLAYKFGKNGCKKYYDNFTWDKVTEKILSNIEQNIHQ